MIKNVQINNKICFAGEQISLVAWGDGQMTAEILCFVRPPSPAQLKTCKECGKFNIVSGEAFSFRTNENIFRNCRGYISVKIIDSTGDTYVTEIMIAEKRGEEGREEVLEC